MIESSNIGRRHDRLTAFLRAFALSTTRCDSVESANLLIIDAARSGGPTHLLYRPRSTAALPTAATLCAASKVDFGGSANPLVCALPNELCIPLADEPQFLGLSELLVAESDAPRCGGGTVQTRLCEVIVVLAIRKAISIGAVDAGLLAGLAHPKLHRSLVALHDDPTRDWRLVELASIAGMSRGQFIATFKQTIGQSPGSYLNGWRLNLGRAALRSGRSVKSAADTVGFGSAAAFSRAFSRKFGYSPVQDKRQAGSRVSTA